MSFYTSLSGLKAAQTDLATISHNLANVGTNGFKKSRSEFADVIASSVGVNPTQVIGSGTVVKANRQQFSQGNLVQTSSALDIAISGDGFFAVKPNPEESAVLYTRNGAFSVNADRYVVDAQGAHLQVYAVDGSGGVVTSDLQTAISLRLPEISGTPAPTSNFALTANLPLNSTTPTNPVFDRFDPSSYNQSTQSTIYDAEGNAETLTNYFRRDGAGAWSIFSFVGDQQLTVGGSTAPIAATFNASGVLTSPAGPIAFDAFTPAGTPTAQQISFNASNITAQLGGFNVTQRVQDGAAVGQIQGVSIDEKGLIKASFSDGTSQVLGKVALVNFANPAGLRQLGASNWSATGLSGEALSGEAGTNGFGDILSGTIERSNVDITEELVGLIAAQRNFQANAKALETAKQISQTIFNIQ